MALTMKERHSVVKELSRGYLRSRKKNRGHILDELMNLTGYNRDYAALLLRGYAHGTVYGPEGVLMKPSVSRTRRRTRIYGEDVHKGLKKIWAIYDCHCGKYMVPGLEEMIRVLEREEEIKLTGFKRFQCDCRVFVVFIHYGFVIKHAFTNGQIFCPVVRIFHISDRFATLIFIDDIRATGNRTGIA